MRLNVFPPEPVAGRLGPESDDVNFDDPGLIYLAGRNVGFDMLKLLR